MFMRRAAVILTIMIFAVSATGCGSKAIRMKLKEAGNALEAGKTKDAIRITKFVMTTNPRNVLAKRLMGKICGRLPDDYQAQVIGWDPHSDFPSTRYRIEREEWRLRVRRKDLPISEPPEFPAPTRRRPVVW